MKIAYIFERDAASPDVQSGRPAAILHAFERAGLSVHRCFPLPVSFSIVERVEQRIARLLSKRYFKGRSRRQLLQMAREVRARLRSLSYDFIFCPGTLPLSYLSDTKPLTFSSDTTLHGILNYYPEFSRLSRFQARAFERAERAVLRKCRLLAYASEWAADSAIFHYGVPKERVAVIPSGANIGANNDRAAIDRFIGVRRKDRINLLFIGKDWARKGGDICLETVHLLVRSGRDVLLHIVGCTPQVTAGLKPHVQVHGLLKPSNPAERSRLEKLFRAVHFLFVPSRAEAYGMAFCEANAFGVPCITTATGGITTIIRNGENGVMLPIDATAADYARAIAALTSDPDRYAALAQNSFREFETRLNWRAWLQNFLSRMEAIVEAGHPPAVPKQP
jgi:glycosyltransferase involved in cell wall biosynthesis